MKHLSNPELLAFLKRDLPAASLLEFDDHLAACPECRDALAREAQAGPLVAHLQKTFAAAKKHLEYEQLRMLAEGETVPAEVERHAAECAKCAAELKELRQFAVDVAAMPRVSVGNFKAAAGPQRVYFFRAHPVWSGLAAAALLAAVAGGYWRTTVRVEPAEPVIASLRDGNNDLSLDKSGRLHGAENLAPDEQNELKAALETGRLAANLPASLSGRHAETMLGAPVAAAPFKVISPLDCVVVDERPIFAWEPMAGAVGYRARVYAAGYRKVAESPLLRDTKWQSTMALTRGESYTWTVTAEGPQGEERQPAPPQPEAGFKVMDAVGADALKNAVRAHAGNPLLLAVLYARAGAVDEARAQIDLLAGQNGQNQLVAQLKASLDQEVPSPMKTNAAQ